MRTNDNTPIGTGWQQQELWHDTPEDALRTVVDALGGPKRVAGKLWPAKSMADGQRLLLHCLDRDRREKLDLAEIMLLGRMARDAGCFVFMAYLANAWDFETPEPLDPDTEEDAQRREFVESVRAQERNFSAQQKLVARLERLDAAREARQLRRVR
ncbi:MAG: hypothetical protein GY788_07350 [bacterium]|nr:hypothetical protein [bacterium]